MLINLKIEKCPFFPSNFQFEGVYFSNLTQKKTNPNHQVSCLLSLSIQKFSINHSYIQKADKVYMKLNTLMQKA